MDNKAMYKLSYGLYVLTANENGKDNGCIINTAGQVTSTPNRISVTVNKLNLTHDMIMNTGVFNVCAISTAADFELFKHFGFQSGKNVDKFAGYAKAGKAENGLMFIKDYCNSYISATVFQKIDLGTHTMFISDVTDAVVLSDELSVTYDYYHANIKPQPMKEEKATGYRCKICGYVYEGDPLPDDFICPICKHPASDFEPI